MSYTPKFNESKVAQLAAYFIDKAGGEIYHLMLMKLLYIADRNALATLGYSISDDNYVSMNYGPVLSKTLSLIDGCVQLENSLWIKLISPGRDHKLFLLNANNAPTDLLSQAELKIADSVFGQYGDWDRFELAEETHKFAEWIDPKGSAIPISYEDILKALDFSNEDTNNILQSLEDVQQAKAFLNSL